MSPATPPPSAPPNSVEQFISLLTLTAAGSPSDYSSAQLDEMAALLAQRAGVPFSDVTLSLEPGSVIITVRIVTPGDQAAMAITQDLSVALATPQAATTFFAPVSGGGISVVTAPVILTLVEYVLPPPSPPQVDGAADELSAGSIVSITIGVLLVSALVAILLVKKVRAAPTVTWRKEAQPKNDRFNRFKLTFKADAADNV